MKASIVLPNLNGGQWLKKCIESLYAQTERDFELIVVDNGSTDESLETARNYLGRPGYTLAEQGENTGFSAAVNTGIALAKAPYVLLFNSDAFAETHMLEKMLEKIEENSRIFAVQALMLRYDAPEKTDDAGDFVTLFGWAFQRGNRLPAEKYQKERRVFSACGGAALYRKSLFAAVGLFDELFFAYLEDVDIGWRANSLGYVSVLCPAARCAHIGGASSGGGKAVRYNAFKSVQSGRNSLLYLYKNMPLLMFILNLPFTLPGYALKTLVFHLRGYGVPWRQGMGQALKALARVQKPCFKWKNLPHYLWVQASLIAGTFRFIGWRVRRLGVR